jgi:hypothetical protein
VPFWGGGQKNSLQRIFINKYFPFEVGSVFRVKRFTTGSRNSYKAVRKSQMMPDEVRKWLRQNSFMLQASTHWRSDGTSVSMLVEDTPRYKYFSHVRISHALGFIYICVLFADCPSYTVEEVHSHCCENPISNLYCFSPQLNNVLFRQQNINSIRISHMFYLFGFICGF